MKKLKIFIIIPIFLSCTSNKNIIQNYLLGEIKNDTIKENIIIKEIKPFSSVIRTFIGFKENKGNSIKPKNDNEFLIIERLKEKYSNAKSNIWSKKDFNNLDVNFIYFDSIDNFYCQRKKRLVNGYYDKNFNIYEISKAYCYKDVLIFSIAKKKFGNLMYKFNYCVIMKKTNGKWKVQEKRNSPDIN